MNTASKIAKESSISFIGMGFGQFIRYIFTALLARWVGAEYLGVYSIANAVTRISEVFGKMGLDTGVLRFVSKNANEIELQKKYIQSGIKMGLIFGVLFMGIQIAVSSWLVIHVFQGSSLLKIVLITNAITLPFGVSTLIMSSATQGFKLLKYRIFVTDMLNPVILLIVMLGSFICLSKEMTIILPAIVSAIVGFVVIFVFLNKMVGVNVTNCMSSSFSGDLITFSIPLMFVAIIGAIMHWTDIMMLGYFTDTETVGLYHPAARTAGLMRTILLAVLGIFSPMMSQYHSQKNFTKMNSIYKLSTRWIISLAIPFVILFVLFSKKVMLLFGPEYLDSSFVLILLTIGAFVQSIFGTAGSSLTMTGYSKVNLINALIVSIVNIVLNIILIPQFGINGAAIATLISLSILGLLRWTQNIILNKIQSFSLKSLKSIFAGLFTFILLMIIKPYIMQYHTIITLLLAVLVTFAVYLFWLWMFKFDDDDKEVIYAMKVIGQSLRKRA